MKFIPLVWKGIWSRGGRATLIFLQMVIAFTLFGILQGLNVAIAQAIAQSHADRLYVMSRVSQGEPMPLALLARLQTLPGVVAVAPRCQFPSTYQNRDEFVLGIATDLRQYVRVYPEVKVRPQELKALESRRDGAIAGQALAQQYHWKIGDRVPLQSPILKKDGSGNWTVEVVGFYTETEHADQDKVIFLNYAYLNETRAQGRDTVEVYSVLIQNPKAAADLAHTIDDTFANSANETHTQSETELAQSELKRIGDLDFIVHGITVATFIALLFAAGTLMMQTFRERQAEFATLKAVGFTNSRVILIILAEALLLSLCGAIVGLLLASQILPLARGFVGVGSIPTSVALEGMGYAVLIALICGATPAWRGLRLRIVDALAGR